MTELIRDFSTDIWTDKGQPPSDPDRYGYKKATIVRALSEDDGDNSKTYVVDMNDGVSKVKLCGILKKGGDPLKQVLNCKLKVIPAETEEGKSTITGIIFEPYWVEWKD